ncbi:MAG: TonB-dependent receptor domain-containing protein [bacterium]
MSGLFRFESLSVTVNVNHKLAIILLFLIPPLLVNSLHAGITGTLSGKVMDQETGQILPGAAIVVEGTTMGTMADKSGLFMIHNLPAGSYDVSANMIGYSKLTIKNVQINVDLNTQLDFHLSTEVLSLREVVVTDQKKLIQSEITSSTYFISGDDINKKLPIDSYLDAVSLLPGVVGSHVRGSRETGALYLLDGLPIQSAFSREIASAFPNSSVVETMVQTGGFNAEYGHASSGLVNVITRDGRNKVEGNLKFYTDSFETRLNNNDNSRRLEFNLGGPLTIGLGGPLISAKYFVSADLNLSDTAHRKQMQEAFDTPIFTNYNINSKLSFDIAQNTILTFQALLSNWKWHQFDPQWQLNPDGLAENKHFSHRLSASITHTFSPKFFASLRLANYSTKRLILGEIDDESPNILFKDPTDPRSLVTSGSQPWNEETKEDINLLKVDLVGQVTSHHLVKTGIEVQNFRLRSEKIQFTALPQKGNQNTVQSIAFNRVENDFDYRPTFYALYIQDKIEFRGITANIGLRYDVFDPKISIEELPLPFKRIQRRLNSPAPNTKSMEHNPLSPRLGVSLRLSKNEGVHFNYGWYHQMPPLYYLYTNSDYRIDTYLPFVGNIDLAPSRTVSTELSYKRVVSDDWLFVLTGFTKKFKNLIDTQTYILGQDQIEERVDNVGYSQYLNSAFGHARGLEVTLQKRFTSAISARMSYTYMKARGTSSTAEDGFKNTLFNTQLQLEGKTEFPLSWDQRHSFILDAEYEASNLTFNVLYRLFSPLPVTTASSSTPNDTRLAWRNLFDVKVIWHTSRFLRGHLTPFFEIRNLFDEQNIIDEPDDTGVRAYRLFDPLSSDQGRRLRIGTTLTF